MTAEIHKMLALSTAHVSKATADLFDMNTDDVPIFYPKRYWDGEEVGWLIPIVEGQDWPHTCPPELLAIRAKAEELGCTWIMLDRDADPFDDLLVFDW